MCSNTSSCSNNRSERNDEPQLCPSDGLGLKFSCFVGDKLQSVGSTFARVKLFFKFTHLHNLHFFAFVSKIFYAACSALLSRYKRVAHTGASNMQMLSFVL
jgi:hypothetical protein